MLAEKKRKDAIHEQSREHVADMIWADVADPDPSLPPVTRFDDDVFTTVISWCMATEPSRGLKTWDRSGDDAELLDTLPGPEHLNRPVPEAWAVRCEKLYAPLKKKSVLGVLTAVYIGDQLYNRKTSYGDHVWFEGFMNPMLKIHPGS